MLPTELFKELMDEDSERTKGDLRKPFTVSYVQTKLNINIIYIVTVKVWKCKCILYDSGVQDHHKM